MKNKENKKKNKKKKIPYTSLMFTCKNRENKERPKHLDVR
jgi:hypothetical protein